MTDDRLSTLIRHLRQLVDPGRAGALTDAQLLERFVTLRDEAAFEVLLWRHGPLVLSVSRRLLGNAADAEDAFQAVFLVMVRKAQALRKRGSLSSWLYKVAYRVALRLRSQKSRNDRAQPLVHDVPDDAGDDLVWRDLRPILDEEVNHLPERYRRAFVLCYLQGRTNEEAAGELGCPVGTVVSRLAWCRQRLRERLTRRGVTLSAGALTAVLTQRALADTLPTALAERTVQASLLYAAGQATSGILSTQALALSEGVIRNMLFTKLKMTAALLALLIAVGAGVGLASPREKPLADDAVGVEPAGDKQKTKKVIIETVPPSTDKKSDLLVELATHREGILVLVGTEIKEGEKFPDDQTVTIKVDGQLKKYRKLREGDKVELGQLLARVDDRLAREEVGIKKAKLESAMADLQAAEKTAAEAKARFETAKKLQERGAISQEEFLAAKLTAERYVFDVAAKKAQLQVAEGELKQALTILEMHEIRSPGKAVLKTIYKRAGEGVKALEAVVQLQLVVEK